MRVEFVTEYFRDCLLILTTLLALTLTCFASASVLVLRWVWCCWEETEAIPAQPSAPLPGDAAQAGAHCPALPAETASGISQKSAISQKSRPGRDHRGSWCHLPAPARPSQGKGLHPENSGTSSVREAPSPLCSLFRAGQEEILPHVQVYQFLSIAFCSCFSKGDKRVLCSPCLNWSSLTGRHQGCFFHCSAQKKAQTPKTLINTHKVIFVHLLSRRTDLTASPTAARLSEKSSFTNWIPWEKQWSHFSPSKCYFFWQYWPQENKLRKGSDSKLSDRVHSSIIWSFLLLFTLPCCTQAQNLSLCHPKFHFPSKNTGFSNRFH